MADNRMCYGFRPNGRRWGSATYNPLPMIVATSEPFNVTGGTSAVGLGVGDPVTRLATGGVTLCAGAETTPVVPYGIVCGIGPNWNAALGQMQFTDVLASATAWGTNLDRQSVVYVLPIEGWYWEIDCNDADAATTKAAYQAFGGENCSFALYGGIAPTSNPQNRAHPRLDIGSHATTNTLALRINRVSDTQDNVDFTGNYVKMIVEINIGGPGGMPNSVVTSTGI